VRRERDGRRRDGARCRLDRPPSLAEPASFEESEEFVQHPRRWLIFGVVAIARSAHPGIQLGHSFMVFAVIISGVVIPSC
jgi:hypothetical protein